MSPEETKMLAIVAVMSVAAITAGMMLIFRGPIGKAIATRIEGRRRPTEDEVLELRARVEELEQAHAKLHELEERIEFSERFLTRPQAHPVERSEQR